MRRGRRAASARCRMTRRKFSILRRWACEKADCQDLPARSSQIDRQHRCCSCCRATKRSRRRYLGRVLRVWRQSWVPGHRESSLSYCWVGNTSCGSPLSAACSIPLRRTSISSWPARRFARPLQLKQPIKLPPSRPNSICDCSRRHLGLGAPIWQVQMVCVHRCARGLRLAYLALRFGRHRP